MSDTPFVHLHCHTDYSLLDGACEISRLIDLVAEQQMPAVAMTDHGNLFGAVEFYNAASARGVHPVIGCEVYVAKKGLNDRTEPKGYNHLLLLCESQEGYRNLIKLVSTSYLEGFYYKPRIDKDLLARHSKGLIAMSACLRGDINETLKVRRFEEARRLANEYTDMFGRGNFFLEIQDHALPDDKVVMPMVYDLSRETGIPLVATNDAHYLRKGDARSHEVMLCIQTGKTMSDDKRMRFDTEEFYLKSGADMLQVFGEIPDALSRTWEIAQRCQAKLEKAKEPFPKFDVPPEHSIDTYFEYVARQGFERRLGRLEKLAAQGALKHDLREYSERLDLEIQMIQKMKFSGYFLVVWDFIRYAKDNRIPVGPGRGSAAGSLVGYAMEIVDIDPLQYGLIFERFLNPERVSLPDIDIDFCTRRRGEVIQYVTEKYGREQVAQIITFGTLAARQAIKDVGRALDMAIGDVDRITKLVPTQLNIRLKDAFQQEPAFAEMRQKDARVDQLLDVATTLEGMARNCSIHAAGVVISPTPLKDIVPLYKTNKDEVVTQYDMVGLEKLGLLKMDFLGLTTLTIIDDALDLIARYRGVQLTLEDIPLNDPAAYDIFSKGFTSGVFQFESKGMRDVLMRYQPGSVEDLCALNALYRPGPIQGGMIDDFIDRKHGRKKVVYELPVLEPILSETYGVIVYQEQVMQVANHLAGYSLGEADLLRRAMGKKKAEEMASQRERFMQGALERGFPQKKAGHIFDLMEQFAGYGFNKSHSAAYAYLAYLTAYLKAHYSLEFMSALLTAETGNTAKVVKYMGECRDMGLRVLPPDVNKSDKNFAPDGDGIRFGLCAIRNVGEGAVESIIGARSDGPFHSIFDLCERVDQGSMNRRTVESLIRAGAFDSLGGRRSQVFAVIDSAMEGGQRAHRDRSSGQVGLFALDISEARLPEPPLPALPDWTDREKLSGEKEMLGFYITGHPLDEWTAKICELRTHTSDSLDEGIERGETVIMCGLMSGVQRKRNKRGELYATFTLEDHNGASECMVLSKQYERLLPELADEKAVMIRGAALPEEGAATKISVQDIIPLSVARVQLPSLISIKVRIAQNGTDKAQELQGLFERKRGETEVRLRLERARDFSVILDVTTRVRPDKEFLAEVERICGPESFEVLAN